MTEPQDPSSAPPIERRANLPHEAFVRDYLMPWRPVILTDATKRWTAIGTWTPEMFKNRYGARNITIGDKTYNFGQFMDLVIGSTRENPSPYLRNQLLEEWLPELMPDVSPLPSCTEPNWLESRLFPRKQTLTSIEIFIGGEGSEFPFLHYDNLHVHAFLSQIYGSKLFVVYPPDQTPYMYPRDGVHRNKSNVGDVENADLLKFPLFAKATPTRFVLKPGETLFVPAGWWHTTRMLGPSITMSANTANQSNWRQFSHDYATNAGIHRPYLRPYLGALAAYLTVMGNLEYARWRRRLARGGAPL